MRTPLTSLLTLSLIGCATAQFFDGQPLHQVGKSKLGAMEVTDFLPSGMQKTVYVPQKSIIQDYERQTQHLQQSIIQDKINKERIAADRIYKCDNRFFTNGTDPDESFYFFPVEVGAIKGEVGSNSITYTDGFCFEQITFTFTHTGDDKDIGDVIVDVDAQKPKSLLCKDWFLFGNAELQHVETFFFSGKHQITFKGLSDDAKQVVKAEGLHIFMFCDGYVDTFISVWNTVLAFVGGIGTNPYIPFFGSHVPEYMVKANVEFLQHTMNYTMEERTITDYDYDESNIQSGDFLAIMRMDGLDPIIMYGSGTHAGHSVMALRFDGELYIIESQDGWYWPRHGIQRNKYSQWIQWARDADFHVCHLPLSPQARANFNETAAQEFFWKTEGLPYGYHNFLFGWIDTPEDNFPALLASGIVPVVFSVLEHFSPSTVDIFFNQALNKRLNTTGLNLEQVAAEGARRNLTIDQIMAMVEVEGWEYTGLQNDGRAYVCSAYVAGAYQAAGLFGKGNRINGPEFTPKDVYTLNVFDLNFKRPDACVQADPNLPYCQLTGKYRMVLPGYSTIEPYNHMAEDCPTIAPDYYRPAHC